MRGLRLLALLLIAACDDAGVPELTFSLAEEEFWPDRSTYPGVGEGRILITNNLEDTVSILDLAAVDSDAFAELARVPVGFVPVEREGPHHLAPDPSGEHYYVGMSNYVPGAGSGPHGSHGTGSADGHLLKIRASDNTLVASTRVDRSPGDVRLTPDGRLVVLSHFDLLRISETVRDGGPESEMDSTLAIVEAESMRRLALVPICPGSHGVAIAPDSSTAYVACVNDEIAVVSLTPPYDVTRVAVLAEPGTVTRPRCSPYALTITPAGDEVWVSCFESGDLIPFSTGPRTVDPSRVVRLPGRAVFGEFTSDGATLLVPHQDVNGFSVVDPAAGVLLESHSFPIEVCDHTHSVRLLEGEQRLLVLCENDHVEPGRLLVVDRMTGEVLRSADLGRYPDDIAILKRAP